MKCEGCGAELDGGDISCPDCGWKVPDVGEPPSEPVRPSCHCETEPALGRFWYGEKRSMWLCGRDAALVLDICEQYDVEPGRWETWEEAVQNGTVLR